MRVNKLLVIVLLNHSKFVFNFKKFFKKTLIQVHKCIIHKEHAIIVLYVNSNFFIFFTIQLTTFFYLCCNIRNVLSFCCINYVNLDMIHVLILIYVSLITNIWIELNIFAQQQYSHSLFKYIWNYVIYHIF